MCLSFYHAIYTNLERQRHPAVGIRKTVCLILLDCLISFGAQAVRAALALRLWTQGPSCKYRCMVIPWNVSGTRATPASSQEFNQGRRQVVDCFSSCQRCQLMNLLGNRKLPFFPHDITIADEKNSSCCANAQSARWVKVDTSNRCTIHFNHGNSGLQDSY